MEVKKQVQTIKEATKTATKSKSAATKFLQEAGIIKINSDKSSSSKKR